MWTAMIRSSYRDLRNRNFHFINTDDHIGFKLPWAVMDAAFLDVDDFIFFEFEFMWIHF